MTIGGLQGALQYHGRSQYPGLDQINVFVPAGVSGCSVPVEARGEKLASNLVTIPVAASGRVCTDLPMNYSYATVPVGNTMESRLYAGQQHFMSVILDSNHAIAIRPHPGLDPNGWGASLYLQPFLPGATLHGTVIQSIAAKDSGIEIAVSGVVSRGASGDYGTWRGTYTFSYSPGQKEITGGGSYDITLSGVLGPATGDMNLYKLATSCLIGVPLLS